MTTIYVRLIITLIGYIAGSLLIRFLTKRTKVKKRSTEIMITVAISTLFLAWVYYSLKTNNFNQINGVKALTMSGLAVVIIVFSVFEYFEKNQ